MLADSFGRRGSMNDVRPISAEEAEQMRELLLKYEREKGPNVFDLSKPPTPPYVHKEFPKVVYDWSKSTAEFNEMRRTEGGGMSSVYVPAKYVTKNVNDPEELAEALSAGWNEKPPVFEPTDNDDVVEVIPTAPRRGRPPKVAQ